MKTYLPLILILLTSCQNTNKTVPVTENPKGAEVSIKQTAEIKENKNVKMNDEGSFKLVKSDCKTEGNTKSCAYKNVKIIFVEQSRTDITAIISGKSYFHNLNDNSENLGSDVLFYERNSSILVLFVRYYEYTEDLTLIKVDKNRPKFVGSVTAEYPEGDIAYEIDQSAQKMTLKVKIDGKITETKTFDLDKAKELNTDEER